MAEPARLDLLAFGPHPDDIEIGMGGAVALHVARGFRVGLCDLTRGEMSSNGTPEGRLAEAEAAAKVLGAALRVNLGLPDRGIGRSPEHLAQVVELIRRHRPRTIAVPYGRDLHPDHVAASVLLDEAFFASGLKKTPAAGEPYRPEWLVYYFINQATEPSFVCDVSAVYPLKRRALDCHASQFAPTGNDVEATRIAQPAFRQLIESRDAYFGARIGVPFAEGFVVRELVPRANLFLT